jgi:high-affinity Fe2+/Pb2+ permease
MTEVQMASDIWKVLSGVIVVLTYASVFAALVFRLNWRVQVESQLFILGLLLLSILVALVYLIEIRTAMRKII